MKYQQRREAALRFAELADPAPRLSLTHPRFNLREVAKQMVLLEDHLNQPPKNCPDCIQKHLLTIEGYAEEAQNLDEVGIYRDTAGRLAEIAREWMEQFRDGRPLYEIGQEVRQARKGLVPLVADPRDAVSRVASRYLTGE